MSSYFEGYAELKLIVQLHEKALVLISQITKDMKEKREIDFPTISYIKDFRLPILM
jgi:hypothetical protein